jgi:hypothetical protein
MENTRFTFSAAVTQAAPKAPRTSINPKLVVYQFNLLALAGLAVPFEGVATCLQFLAGLLL